MAPRQRVSHYGTKSGACSQFQIYSRSLILEKWEEEQPAIGLV